MSCTRVTITGADDGVDPAALVELSAEFPFVEWGILFSVKRQGTLGCRLGYAGGIGPGNVEQVLYEIAAARVESPGDYWIDMESGVRTDDRFDLVKVWDVLCAAKRFMGGEA